MTVINKINDKDPKFIINDIVSAKSYSPNWLEKVFVIKKVKNTVPWTYLINDLNGEEIFGTFYEKEIAESKSKRI